MQGVGFRPCVHALATRLGLVGVVGNDAAGVFIEAAGARVDELATLVAAEAPPLSRIERIEVAASTRRDWPAGFVIVDSDAGGAVSTAVVPDTAVCEDCLDEMFNPADRRHRHAFITCTHCGPRYTLTARLPYDRPQTALADFPLCPACAAEYRDPRDRRFHAETTCCPRCGPRLAVGPREIAARLAAGAIVAIKGIGGYHLACDARDEAAVARLRTRKQREAKPLAVMVANLASAHALAEVDAAAAALLSSRERPIVVVRARPDAGIAASVSQGLPTIGLMLPYTPIQWLVLHALLGEPAGDAWRSEAQPVALVMTSANPHGEPLVHDDADATSRLAGIADLIVGHDRAILVRCDDSVLHVVDGAPAFIRRARGYVPEPLALPADAPATVAVGGYLKNTVCVTRGREAWVSQHVGDLDNAEARRYQIESIEHLVRILGVRPERVVHDRHPDFPGTQWARASGLPVVAVQHHHAHVAAVLGEHGHAEPALGLALDGYGYGDDGGAWGGELFHVDGARCLRLGSLSPLALPGGDRCARETWRCAAAALHAAGLGRRIAGRFATEALAPAVARLLDGGGVPATSSAGRWFDAACGLAGLHWHSHYEGQAPMALEALVRTTEVVPGGWSCDGGGLDLRPLVAHLVDADALTVADRFHGTLCAALADWCYRAAMRHDTRVVALSGGCFLNRVLAEGVAAALRAAGLKPLLATRLPPNDGAIAYGQAVAAALAPD